MIWVFALKLIPTLLQIQVSPIYSKHFQKMSVFSNAIDIHCGLEFLLLSIKYQLMVLFKQILKRSMHWNVGMDRVLAACASERVCKFRDIQEVLTTRQLHHKCVHNRNFPLSTNHKARHKPPRVRR